LWGCQVAKRGKSTQQQDKGNAGGESAADQSAAAPAPVVESVKAERLVWDPARRCSVVVGGSDNGRP
jgi:hypothetical protein